jgi:DNA-binding NtrC family response regulator
MSTKASIIAILTKNETSGFPTLKEVQEGYIDAVLEHTKGKKTQAARILGCNRRTLYRRPNKESQS